MAMFKKRGDVLDLTLLQKRGILKKAENGKINEITDVLDLTNIPQNQTQTSQSPFDFLDSLAQTNSSQSNQIQSSPSSFSSNIDVQEFKVKLEDLEYKLDRFLERLNKIEEELLKRKI